MLDLGPQTPPLVFASPIPGKGREEANASARPHPHLTPEAPPPRGRMLGRWPLSPHPTVWETGLSIGWAHCRPQLYGLSLARRKVGGGALHALSVVSRAPHARARVKGPGWRENVPTVLSGPRVRPWLHRPVQPWGRTQVPAGRPAWRRHCRSAPGPAPGGLWPAWAKTPGISCPLPTRTTPSRAGSSRPRRRGIVGPGWGPVSGN